MDTYWKSPEYVIRPRERLMPPIMINPASVRHEYIREYRGSCPLMLSEEQGELCTIQLIETFGIGGASIRAPDYMGGNR